MSTCRKKKCLVESKGDWRTNNPLAEAIEFEFVITLTERKIGEKERGLVKAL